ncbi:CRM-domain containing factor CFM2, chloroplastic isoform X1 [Cynara cardunculus var. scolymus]|uniref:CRM-domain containing factor CFM2, chloroplastic isoform X1 n=1 Tax=Cynara cardunculus var. scolymus TaxID=59895 RepID=UPI000D625B7C|nr:CRM-domain containing factor CFM2, chloroplastic isoform X1 [Cynara cardunculus var. scolymus]
MLLQQPSPSPKTLSNPFFSHLHLPKNLQFKSPFQFRRNSFLLHASASSAADTQSLPQSAIRRIADKLRSLGYVDDNGSNQQQSPPEQTLSTSPGEIFVPLPNRLPKYRVGHTLDPSWSTPENPVPEPGSGTAIRRYHELRREVWKEKKEEKIKRRIEGNSESDNVPTMAELKLPLKELRRLRGVGIAIKEKLKIGKAGITEGIVNGIHERWRRTELVKIVCEDMCRLNMKRTHDLLERKTGGLVIWRAGSIIILYRGADYKYPYFFVNNVKPNDASDGDLIEEGGVQESYSQMKTTQPPLIQGVGSRTRVRFQLPGEAQLAEEADQLLEGLGPRFTDWYGYDPQPVDADHLPAVVSGYRKPFRLLPFGVQPKLTNDEMTMLRRLGRPLPCHFALGRNRKLQGLAAAILKLWEKCEIAKIAVKRGVQNTNSDLMAEELKWLTGGTLLTRDKEYIVLYRGKDFLPATVSSAIEQRRNRGVNGFERKKIRSSSDAELNKDKRTESPFVAKLDGIRDQKLEVAIEQRKLRSREAAVKRTSSKLSQALESKERAEKLLEELEKQEIKQELEVDKEGITEEERYMLRKVGLKMRPFLLLGRRGVFDGTVENMHLHWKYRELVKILTGETSIDELYAIARTLEAESGGILVAVERVRKGHAIIVYRGKNYKRPASLRPQTLLNKREALKRSIEAQRRESLKLHVLKLGKNVEELKLKLAKNEETERNCEKDEKVQLEHEIVKSRSAEYMEPHTVLSAESMEPDSDPELYKSDPTDQDNRQGRELHEGVLVSLNENDGLKASQGSPETNCQDQASEFSMELDNDDQTRQQDLPEVSSIKHADEDDCGSTEANSNVSSVFVEGISGFPEMNNENEKSKTQNTSTFPDAFKLERSLSTEPCEPVIRSEMPFSPIHGPSVTESSGKRHRSALLSNKERLLLRKQALKMKKRPVLAVGRSNIVSGVAKTIKTHFEKHPLAIVNIKGRAKGTSVQEVVLMLEEATGGILVSQEPSKVILYRGWGATTTSDSNRTNGKHEPRDHEGMVKPIISPELISAIRLECGLQDNKVP